MICQVGRACKEVDKMKQIGFLLWIFLSTLLSAQETINVFSYYPIVDKNEWRYTAPEGWKDGDYISRIEKDDQHFDRFYNRTKNRKEIHESYIGESLSTGHSYLHFDATNAAKILHTNVQGIYYIGELFSDQESFVLFDEPILWFAASSFISQEINETRDYTRYYEDGHTDRGVFSISQVITGKESATVSSGTNTDCLRIDFDTSWQLSPSQTATSSNIYHYARNVGVVKASARFIIRQNEQEVINRLVEPDLKAFKVSSSKKDNLSAKEIMKRAHAAAGGSFWSKPQSLTLVGHGLFYKNGETYFHQTHKMYRVFENTKEDAHKANGKVRIESYRDGNPIILVTFDGENTYTLSGKQPKSDADLQWSSNFGYGAIRHALDEGYLLERIPDDKVDGHPSYIIKVTDLSGGDTYFGIRKSDYKIVKVAFDTPRGWHERVYSDFFTKPDYNWQQSGRVRLFYNGIKSNEIIWSDFDVNQELPDNLFKL